MENYRVHPFMQNKNGYEMILETHPFGTVSRCSTTLAGAITTFTDNRDNTDSDLHDIGTLLSNAAADTDPLSRQLQTTRDTALHTYRKLAVLRPYGLPDTEWQRCNATLFSAACNLHALHCHHQVYHSVRIAS
jgi:hypothetical protein